MNAYLHYRCRAHQGAFSCLRASAALDTLHRMHYIDCWRRAKKGKVNRQ